MTVDHAARRLIEERRLENFVHSVLIIGGMILLMGALGWLLAGLEGLTFLGVVWLTVMVLSPQVSPRLVLRLYRARLVTYAASPTLIELVRELSRRAGLSCTPALFYVPSRIANAFSLGRCNDAAIGVTDGLVRRMDLRELQGILAHEISHIAHNDVWVMGLADLVSRTTHLLSWAGQFLLLVNLPLLLLGQVTVPWAAVVLLILAPSLSVLLQLALSRTREYRADLEAARITGDPRGLAAALGKLESLKSGFWERVFLPGRHNPEPSVLRTHPPTAERIRRLLELEEAARPEPIPPPVFTEEPAELIDFPVVVRVPSWRFSGLWH